MPEIGCGIGLPSQERIFLSRLAGGTAPLLCHFCYVLPQKGKGIKLVRGDETLRVSLFGRSLRFLDAVQREICQDNIAVPDSTPREKAQALQRFSQASVVLPKTERDGSEQIRKEGLARKGSCTNFKDLSRLYQVACDRKVIIALDDKPLILAHSLAQFECPPSGFSRSGSLPKVPVPLAHCRVSEGEIGVKFHGSLGQGQSLSVIVRF